MSNVLIAGCGDIGMALAKVLQGTVGEVYGLRRNITKLRGPLLPVAADLSEPRSLRAVPCDVQHVVYTATPGSRAPEAYERAYVSGLRNLLQELASRSDTAPRLYFASSTSVYGQADGSWVDEHSPTEPTSYSGRLVLQGETVALESGFAATCVRFGGIYGPGRNRLIERVRHGAVCVEDPPQFTNRIHRDDCVRVLAHLLTLDDLSPRFVAVDDRPAPECEVLDWLAKVLDAPRPVRHALGAAAARSGSKRCSNDRLRNSGFVFRYPSYREGYTELLRTLTPGPSGP